MIVAQLQREPFGCLDCLNTRRIPQPFGQAGQRVRALELPAIHIGQGINARHVVARQADFFTARLAVEQLDQRARQRLDAFGGYFHPPAVGQIQLDGFVILHFRQHQRIQPTRINLEQLMQQGSQRHALAVDHDTHVQAEPAIFLLVEFTDPGFHFQYMMAETLRVDDFPARRF